MSQGGDGGMRPTSTLGARGYPMGGQFGGGNPWMRQGSMGGYGMGKSFGGVGDPTAGMPKMPVSGPPGGDSVSLDGTAPAINVAEGGGMPVGMGTPPPGAAFNSQVGPAPGQGAPSPMGGPQASDLMRPGADPRMALNGLGGMQKPMGGTQLNSSPMTLDMFNSQRGGMPQMSQPNIQTQPGNPYPGVDWQGGWRPQPQHPGYGSGPFQRQNNEWNQNSSMFAKGWSPFDLAGDPRRFFGDDRDPAPVMNYGMRRPR